MEKQNFYDLNFDQLKNFLIDKAEVDGSKAKMRAQQMFNAVYKKNIKSFDELTTFGLELREKIKNPCPVQFGTRAQYASRRRRPSSWDL